MFGKKPPNPAKLREALAEAMRHDRTAEALRLYGELEQADAKEPRWSHRKGDLLQRLKKPKDAIIAYERAINLYAELGFVARAVAMAKVILQLDPSRTDVIDRVDPEVAREVQRKARLELSHEPVPPPGQPVTMAPPPDLIQEAALLTQDPKSSKDRTAFDVPEGGTGTSTINVFELEVAQRDTMSDEDEVPTQLFDPPTAEQLAQLPANAIFAEVPPDAFQRIVKQSELRTFPAGTEIIREGMPANMLFSIVEGSLKELFDSGKKPILLCEGDIFGEACLFQNAAYVSHVITIEPTQVLCIPKNVLDQLVSEYRQVENVLIEVLARRLITNVVLTSPIFVDLPPQSKALIASSFELRRAAQGTRLLEEGKKGDGLYISLLGSLRILKQNRPLHLLPPGQTLGDSSLLSDQPAQYTVEADSDALVLRMPRNIFLDIIQENPSWQRHFRH